MIALTRVRTEIDANFYGEKKKKFEKELLINQRRVIRGELKKHHFDSERWKKAKAQLIAETGGKCAYCEAPTTLVAYGDVEHYRPKRYLLNNSGKKPNGLPKTRQVGLGWVRLPLVFE